MFPERYVDDIRNAISYLQTRSEVDPDRIGLWGHSLGATVALQTAALDRRVTCVACQNPSMFNDWRAMEKSRGRAGVQAMLDALDQDQRQRFTGREDLTHDIDEVLDATPRPANPNTWNSCPTTNAVSPFRDALHRRWR